MGALVLSEEELPRVTGIEWERLSPLIAAGRFPPPRQITADAAGWLRKEVADWEAARQAGRAWKPAPRKFRKPGVETELYRHFDEDGRLLYVGISLSTATRLCQHRLTAKWARQVTTITIERFPSREEALKAELRAIRTENPAHNKAGRPAL